MTGSEVLVIHFIIF